MRPERLWTGPAGAALAPLGLLYSAGWVAYHSLYRFGLKKAIRPHSRVVCVGGLVAGGAGKSPVVLHVARVLSDLGWRVTIGASGYGAPRAEAASMAPSGPLDPAEWGDEPAMMRHRLPDVPLVVGRRRVLAAELAALADPGGVLLMDDGFQHLPLAKTVSLVVDAANPPLRRCLPAGPYREPRGYGRRRADRVLETGAEAGWRIEYSPLTFRGTPPRDGDSVLCALGHPQSFLASLPFRPGATLLRPDHDPLRDADLWNELPREGGIVVTEKDWIKLRQRSDFDAHASRIVVATRDAVVEPRHEFAEWLHNKLNDVAD